MKATRLRGIALPCAFAIALSACERETRPFNNLPAATAQKTVGTDLFAGEMPPPRGETSPFQENAWGISEGKRLFTQFNCAGCHANGGGGMGPALMDDEWIYGRQASNIFETIVAGRPNGMPTFRNKIQDAQVWQLVAFVQSMSGQAPIDALPGRSDHMRYSTPENARRAEPAVQTGKP
jgi:cytochrome c oxidase cbb3-type subunit III